MSKESIKVLLQFGIGLLSKLIPWLGGFVGGPFGFIASWAIGWLTGKLFDWLEQMERFKAIDDQVKKDVADAKVAQGALRQIQDDKNSTGEQRAKALDDFAAAVRKLGRFKLQQN